MLVSDYLSLHIKLFPNLLKIKHHIILHYPRVMRKYGSLKKSMTCLRFEGKHMQVKENSKTCKSRVNPAFTLAVKHQLQLCYRFLCNQGDDISTGTVISKLHLTSNYSYFRKFMPCDTFKDYDSITWIIINGIRYDMNSVLCISINENNSVFARVKHIVLSPSNNIFFVYTKMRTICHCRHLCAFEVNESQKWGFISQKDLIDFTVYYIKLMPDKKL